MSVQQTYNLDSQRQTFVEQVTTENNCVDTENWTKYGVKHVSMFISNQRLGFDKLIKEHGDTVGLKQGRMMLVTRDLSILKEVMVKDFNNFVDRPGEFHTHSKINKSVFFLKGQDWRRIRHIITPSFSTGKLKNIMSTINERAKRLSQVLEDYARKDFLVPIKQNTGQYTGEIIARTAFGFNSDCLGGEDDEFIFYSKKLLKVQSKIFKYLVPFIIRFSNIHGFLVNKLKMRTLDAVNADSDRYFNLLLINALQYRQEAERNGQKLPQDLLQSFITAEKASANISNADNDPTTNGHSAGTTSKWTDNKFSKIMSEGELIAQSLLIIFAGFETTATTLQMCYYLLAKHPDVQEKMYQEIINVVKAESPTFEELSQLIYMEQVINETLRLFPPAPVMSREAAETKTYNGITIPKKTAVFIPIFSVLTDPKNFPQPEKFDPDRFSEENKSQRDVMAFMPFGYGPRLCIGMRLAYQEIKTALVHTIRKVRFELNDKTEPKKGEEPVITYNFNLVTLEKPLTLAVKLRNT
ncbi:hypothetical protein Btru_045754 [Bulinus truncatus]|nr:hypothetical protein Btru_045754 [Bulinus truncatus]